jgi:hypothetical protein
MVAVGARKRGTTNGWCNLSVIPLRLRWLWMMSCEVLLFVEASNRKQLPAESRRKGGTMQALPLLGYSRGVQPSSVDDVTASLASVAQNGNYFQFGTYVLF